MILYTFLFVIASLLSLGLISLISMSGGTIPADVPTPDITASGKTEIKTIPVIQDWKTRLKNQDAQIDTFVSKSISLTDPNYAPSDLVDVGGIPEIGQAGRVNKIRKIARDSLWTMARDFDLTFGKPMIVISAYRSAAYQQRMWDLGKCTDSLCAPPGHSEHQLGLAVDLFDASTEEDYYKNPKYVAYVQWLQRYAHLYGWTQSYQNGENIDEYEVEPWHWRYVGVELATKLHKLGWTLTQYNRFQYLMNWR